MRTTFSLFIALFICALSSSAQPEISLSEPFEDPGTATWKKVLQLKNGNTFFFHLTREALEVTVYDKTHKAKSQTKHNGKEWEARQMRGSTVTSLQEINGEPVLFFTTQDKGYNLFRLCFNAEDGSIKDEKKLGTIVKYEPGEQMLNNGFYVEKDPASDYYAVVMFNSSFPDAARRLNLTYYSNTHQELATAPYGKPANYSKLNYIGLAVDNKQATIVCCGYNSDNVKVNDGKLVVSCLQPGQASITHKVSDVKESFKFARGVLRFNPGTGKIHMLTSGYVEVDKTSGGGMWNKITVITNNTLTMLSAIDPATLEITAEQVSFKKISELERRPYPGNPQDLIINADNSMTILSEDLVYKEIRSSGHTSSATGRYFSGSTRSTTNLENMGITHISMKGEETKAYTLPKSQMYGIFLGPFIHAIKTNGFWTYQIVNFLSYDYINTGNKQYVIYNDYPENFSEKVKPMVYVSGATMMCYELGQTEDKYYLFGKPDDKGNLTFSDLRASHFQATTNTYATLVIEKGRDKQARVAWMTFK